MRIDRGINQTDETHWLGWIRAWPWEAKFLRKLAWCRAYYCWREHYFSIETDDIGLARILLRYHKQTPLERFTLVQSHQVWGLERKIRKQEVLALVGQLIDAVALGIEADRK